MLRRGQAMSKGDVLSYPGLEGRRTAQRREQRLTATPAAALHEMGDLARARPMFEQYFNEKVTKVSALPRALLLASCAEARHAAGCHGRDTAPRPEENAASAE